MISQRVASMRLGVRKKVGELRRAGEREVTSILSRYLATVPKTSLGFFQSPNLLTLTICDLWELYSAKPRPDEAHKDLGAGFVV